LFAIFFFQKCDPAEQNEKKATLIQI